MPPLADAAQLETQRAAAPMLALHVSMLQLIIDFAMRELLRLTTGRSELCDLHRLQAAERATGTSAPNEVETIAQAVSAARSTGFAVDGIVRHFTRNDEAVTRHTLARFARLWQELRPALPPALVTRSDIASVVKELDVLTSEVLE
jgi:hypothetical protein